MAVPLNPGEANRAVLTFMTEIENKYQRMMTKPPEAKFDGSGHSLRSFVQRVKQHVALGGWGGIFMIRDVITGTSKNLLDKYGIIPIQDVRIHVQAIYVARLREAQDDQMLFLYLSTSMTDFFSTEVTSQSALYTIHVPYGNYSSGLLFLKLMLTYAKTDTIGSVNEIRIKITNLSHKMVELQGNILEFHSHVRTIINDLAAYGTDSTDLHVNVLWAYGIVEDDSFTRFAEKLQWEWNQAPTTPLSVHMAMAESEYNVRLQRGNWKAPSAKDNTITALRATIASDKKVAATSSPSNASHSTPKKNNQQFAERIAAEKISSPWKWEAPNSGAPWSKMEKDVKYNWCSKHAKWVTTHTDAECKGANAPSSVYKKKGKNVVNAATNEETSSTLPEVKVDTGMAAFITGSSSLY